jgi:hypothetical protein
MTGTSRFIKKYDNIIVHVGTHNKIVLYYTVPYPLVKQYCKERFMCYPDFNRAPYRAKTSVVDLE